MQVSATGPGIMRRLPGPTGFLARGWALMMEADARSGSTPHQNGEIPARKVGARWAIPTAWLREQAGAPEPSPDVDELADQVAARVVARLARLLAQAGDAGP